MTTITFDRDDVITMVSDLNELLQTPQEEWDTDTQEDLLSLVYVLKDSLSLLNI